jgi:DDE_Tnp_1-associated/Transposase DDE domain
MAIAQICRITARNHARLLIITECSCPRPACWPCRRHCRRRVGGCWRCWPRSSIPGAGAASRHRLAVILALAVCAVLAGARSFTAIAEWAADADEETLVRLGVSGPVPSGSTFRRTLQRLDADAFDELAGWWAAQRAAPQPGARRVIAVDGKTLRGSGHGGQDSRHLLAALDHAHGVVLGQVEVDATTNEIPRFSALLDRIQITDAVITADALHAQHAHAGYLHRRGAHFLLPVKRNQPACMPSSPPCPGATSQWPTPGQNAGTATPSGTPSRSSRWSGAWPSRTPPTPSRSPAAAK